MNKPRSKGFTLIELLVVIAIIAVLASMLMGAIHIAKITADRVAVQSTIGLLMTALTAYHNEFNAYPPGARDIDGDGVPDGSNPGSGTPQSSWVDEENPTVDELQLRAVCWAFAKKDREGKKIGIVVPYMHTGTYGLTDGALCDKWGRPFRYLKNGGRYSTSTGIPMSGRVIGAKPVIWSLGPDGRQDPGNDNRDNNGNGEVDEPEELVDDICSWNL